MTDKENKKKEKSEDMIPPLELSSVILPFFTQALVQMGQVAGPADKKTEENLDLAKRMIDLLDLLKQRTEGNLKPEEEKFLSHCLHQVRMIYMEKTKAINL